MRARGLLGCALAAAAIVVTGPAAPALAGTQGPTKSLGEAGGLDYLRTRFPNVASQAGPTTACTGTDQITGGGAAIGGKPKNAHLDSSGPVASADSWLGEGRTKKGSETVTSWAICGPNDTTQIGSTDSIGTAQYNSGFSCNAGDSVSGGVTSSGGNVLINGLFPDDGGSDTFDWTDSYQNLSSASTTVRSSVVCAAFLMTRRSESVKAKPGTEAKAIAKCLDTEAVAGGGVAVQIGTAWQSNVWAMATRPWDSKEDGDKIPDDGWYAKSYNGTDAKVTVTSYASCVPAF